MTVRDLYPDTYPSLLLDFANVKALDPRVTFTRASSATYIDVIGTMYEPTGQVTVDEEGMEIPVVAPAPGWHVNVRLMPDEDGTALEQYRVYPNTPSRVWA